MTVSPGDGHEKTMGQRGMNSVADHKEAARREQDVNDMCLGVALPFVAELGLRSVGCRRHQVCLSQRDLLPAPLGVLHLRHVHLGMIKTAMRREP